MTNTTTPRLKFSSSTLAGSLGAGRVKAYRRRAGMGPYLLTLDFTVDGKPFARMPAPLGPLPSLKRSMRILKRNPPMEVDRGIAKAMLQSGSGKVANPATAIDDLHLAQVRERALGLVHFGARWKDVPRLLGLEADAFNRLVATDKSFQEQLRQCAVLGEWRHLVNLNALACRDTHAAMFLLERRDRLDATGAGAIPTRETILKTMLDVVRHVVEATGRLQPMEQITMDAKTPLAESCPQLMESIALALEEATREAFAGE